MENNNYDIGIYIIDKQYKIVNMNQSMRQMYPEVCIGDICYKSLASNDTPCQTCPIINNEVLFYNPYRKEWITANAATIDYPEHGECYDIHFKRRSSIGGTKREIIRMEKIDEHIADLKSITGDECIIGAYCEPGSPIFYANENMITLMGYSTLSEMVDAIDGMTVNTIHPDDRKRIADDLKGDNNEGSIFETSYRMQKKDGSWIWVVNRGKVIRTSHGKLATICVCSDISSFLKYHSELQIQNMDLVKKDVLTETLMNKIPGCYHRCSTEEGYPFLYISESFEKAVGWTKDEIETLFDNKFINLIYPEDMHLFDGLLEQIVNSGQGSTIYRLKRKGGGYRWVQDSTMFIESDDSCFYQCTLADITEFVHEREEMTLRNTELLQKANLFESIAENIPSGFHRCEAKEGCPIMYIGEYFTEIVGFTREEIKTQFDNLYMNLIWPEDVKIMSTYDEMRKKKGHGNSYDTSIYRVKHKDGGYRWVTDSTMYIDQGEDSFFQGTIADITPYIDELEAAKVRAEASNKAKSTFLFNASHDIRTPMNAIQGFTQILKQHPDDTQLVVDTVAKIEKSSDTLMKLLNDVLELSRIESGKEKVSVSVINIDEFSEKLLMMFNGEGLYSSFNVEMKNNIQNKLIWCDELKLTQIAMNMISNARKFTPADGTITFGVEQLPYNDEPDFGLFRFYVKDTGIGMSEEFLSRAFEQFERERTATESGVMGSGLGLSIIKKLTELMGGTCSLKSKLGKGTEISSTIKCHLANECTDEPKEHSNDQMDFSGKRVLLVEDNEFNREIATFVLKSMDIWVEEAENGYIALNMLLNSNPGYYDLILMDIQMPVMDGYLATKEIRCISDPKLANIPIIAMTANAFKEDQEKCLEAGMNEHLSKPIDANTLAKVMAMVLS